MASLKSTGDWGRRAWSFSTWEEDGPREDTSGGWRQLGKGWWWPRLGG